MLAYKYGWKPMGTKAPEIYGPCVTLDWEGQYYSNNHQIVTRNDAAAMADALESALDDIPDSDGGEDWKSNLFIAFSGDGKQQLRDFIKFCRNGDFVIG